MNDGMKTEQKIETPDSEFPESYEIMEKKYSPLSVLHYNLRFHFQDDYPAKMPEDFARDMILLYSKEDDIVWDGCCGSGIVPRVANRLGRLGIGTDVNPKAIDLAIRHQKQETSIPINKKYFVADARTIVLDRDSGFGIADLILSSLPFGLNIIGDKNNYSDEPQDISHCKNYEEFFAKSKQIIQNYYNNLKPNGVCILDARDRLDKGKTIPLVLRFLEIAEQVGFELVTRFYYELIPYRQMTYKHKPSGYIKAMPAAMDVLVLVKPVDGKLESFVCK